MPKVKIEEAAAQKQARIDKGEEVIVGVNKFQPTQDTKVDIRDIDNAAVRDAQIARLTRIRETRDVAAHALALENLEAVAKGDGNILEAAIEAARARATVGEISWALQNIFGRHAADIVTIEGVYKDAYGDDPVFQETQNSITNFAKKLGRKPRVLVVKMGQDGHDRGAKVIATAFGDLGFDVTVGPLFLTPEEAADLAVSQDVDIVGVSSHAAGHKTLAPMLLKELATRDAADKIVICGGVIPSQDYDFLTNAGVKQVFGPGTNIPEAAMSLIDLLQEQLRGRNR
jgi:methylmalonyl-CoA mutase